MKYFSLAICILFAVVGFQAAQFSATTQSTSAEYAPSAEALQQIVDVYVIYVKRAQAWADTGQGTTGDVNRLRVQLAEARRDLAIELDQPEQLEEALIQLRRIVDLWEHVVKEQELRHNLGQGNPFVDIEAEVQLISRRNQLSQAEEAVSRE
ncbi:MAG: hypothetical protein QGG73_02730 [Candidatus Hydrogenedentes bacterium]|jgi:outer membrane protein TolC|nr:hypothetical protein [Candidatus Hydrogenedentota bacterium]